MIPADAYIALFPSFLSQVCSRRVWPIIVANPSTEHILECRQPVSPPRQLPNTGAFDGTTTYGSNYHPHALPPRPTFAPPEVCSAACRLLCLLLYPATCSLFKPRPAFAPPKVRRAAGCRLKAVFFDLLCLCFASSCAVDASATVACDTVLHRYSYSIGVHKQGNQGILLTRRAWPHSRVPVATLWHTGEGAEPL